MGDLMVDGTLTTKLLRMATKFSLDSPFIFAGFSSPGRKQKSARFLDRPAASSFGYPLLHLELSRVIGMERPPEMCGDFLCVL